MAKPRKENVNEKERRYLNQHNKAQKAYYARKYKARVRSFVIDVFELEMEGLTATEIAGRLYTKWKVNERK